MRPEVPPTVRYRWRTGSSCTLANSCAATSGCRRCGPLYTFKGSLTPTKSPVDLSIIGSAKVSEKDITHEAAPAEDRMQAFPWRHLVPAGDLEVLVFDPTY